MNKYLLSTSFGTLLEWAEFTFYAYLSFHIANLFFPTLSASAGILSVLATFAISYVVRPVGGFYWGYIGDRFGRRKALSSSMALIGISTLGIGLLPTYQSIGIIAPILLCLFRILQGISIAGEFNGASVYILEIYGKNKPYLYSSCVSIASALGMLIGALAAVIISLPGMPIWAWRIPFFISFLGCYLSYYIRRSLMESQEYLSFIHQEKERNKNKTNPIKIVFKFYKLALLRTISVAAFVGVYIYTCNIWWVTYVTQHHFFTNLQAKILGVVGHIFVVILTPLAALVAEKTNAKLIMLYGLIATLLFIPAFFIAAKYSNMKIFFLLEFIYAACDVCVTATMFPYLQKLFPLQARYSGQAIGWNIAIALFGGTAPLVAQFLADININLTIFYVIAFSLFAIIMRLFTEPRGEPIFIGKNSDENLLTTSESPLSGG